MSLNLQSLALGAGLKDDAVLLFSESNTRFVLEVPAKGQAAVELLFTTANVPVTKLGEVTATQSVVIQGARGTKVIDSSLTELKQVWKSRLAWE